MTEFNEIRKLYGISEAEHFGYSETEILNFEETNNIKLPKVLRDYYLSLGKHKILNESYNRLLEPNSQIGFSDDRYLVFYEENQGVIFWGINENDLSLENPKIYGNYDAINLSEEWFEDSPNIEKFLLSMAILNGTLGGLKYNANKISEDELKAETLEIIEKKWEEIKNITFQSQRYFTNDFNEVITLSINSENKPSGIFIGTNHKDRFISIIEEINITWDYRSDEDE
ncbi:hypothetical protein B0I22_1471 [Epilithonimonas xixisoli]|uniref:SMI1/KNR4 family protein SUKH-1 n=2 Tax=Epilithonimonas xixisoli TaxID=1476462 RepID=A0A4R8IJU0_9FLAO|nr:hypothetical protein B0I22_1471 [Epilithonimonas xixisoli]